ncbi:ferric reductase-like transmembrane domain-containing protein [Actinomycetospora cinnamomea]|uniref:Ferric reductase like protein n=1 Tax=Actinomycetospora cinnamomea TaxID=663609 RepID=A0A2U1E983_9PSEU|nr:ferric reductase-like transmembrane domain-containing protein [Actinomycetospora cinnamomea]PVY96506.1 ferric reductase like protein [Actinomycetospora cinnamomea]
MIELWNVSRALGLVALLLLSVVIALGALHNTTSGRAGQTLPRFVLVALHRNLALITVVFVALHVAAVIVTPYLPLRWYHVVVPGSAGFNPWPVGLGAVALDLLLAVVISSSLRRFLSKRAWLVVHWTSYVCFPVAVAHAVANASFRGGTWWTLVVPLIGTGVVVAALLHRRSVRRRGPVPLAARGRTDPAEARRAGDHATGSQPVVGDGPGRSEGGGARVTSAASGAAGDALAAQAEPGSRADGGEDVEPPRPPGTAVHEMRVVARPAERPASRGRHDADPEDDAGAAARTDTLAGPEAPTVGLRPRRRRRQ